MPPAEWIPFPYNVSFRDTVIYNPAYLPVVFDGKILPSNLDFLPKDNQSNIKTFHLIPEEKTLAPEIEKAKKVELMRRKFYTNMYNIKDVKYSSSALQDIPKFNEEDVTRRNILHDLITAEDPIRVSPFSLPKADVEYKYWTKNGEHSIQIAQNYISDNWYKGGNSSFYITNKHKLLLNYKKDKITFNNSLEWRLNVMKTPADSVNAFSISEDLIRLENIFGYKAFDNWSYSAKLETQTQLFSSYPINSKKKNTAFLAPLIVNFGLGMNYSLDKKFESDKHKKLKLSQNIAPLSLNYIFLNETDIIKTQGIEAGKHYQFEVGSLINTDLTFNFNRYMAWTSRLKYFTNYKRAELEFENNFNMALNRFLSTTISMYMRFDDNVPKDNKQWGYFQMNEMVRFGVTYNW
jgi:hypothetical protein